MNFHQFQNRTRFVKLKLYEMFQLKCIFVDLIWINNTEIDIMCHIMKIPVSDFPILSFELHAHWLIDSNYEADKIGLLLFASL